MVATEFVSSGSDFYEIFLIDDVAEPLEPSINAGFRPPQEYAIRRDVAFTDQQYNKYGMLVGYKHETFTKINATEQQIFTLPWMVSLYLCIRKSIYCI